MMRVRQFPRKRSFNLLALLFLLSTLVPSTAVAAIFTYSEINEPIISAKFSVDFAALVAHRSVLGYELNYAKLVDLSTGLGEYDLSDDLFGTAAFPDLPKISMGQLETGIISVNIGSSFFPALATGQVGLAFLFTDTDDSMFAMDFMSLTIQTDSTTVESFYGWPVGNENNGFGIGLADGADLPAPLPFSIPIGATISGWDSTNASKSETPEPASLILFAGGTLALFLKRTRQHNNNKNKKKFPKFLSVLVIFLVCGQFALAVHISDVNFCQLDLYGKISPRIVDSNCGEFVFTLVPDNDSNNYYLNLAIRRDANSPVYWVVDNMLIPFGRDLNEPFTLTRFFSFGDMVQSGTSIASLEYQYQLSTEPWDNAPSGGSFIGANVQNDLYDPGNGFDAEDLNQPELSGSGSSSTLQSGMSQSSGGPSGMTGGELRDDVPNVEEDVNECGPASVARSLLWLHKRKMINLGKPKNEDPNTLADSNNLKREFSKAAGRAPNKPIENGKKFLEAKLKITKNLKVVNRFMLIPSTVVPKGDFNSPDGTAYRKGFDPTFAFIRRQFDANEDIELCFGMFPDPNKPKVRKGGHWVTIVSVEEDPDTGKKEILVQDDPNQGKYNGKSRYYPAEYVDGHPARLIFPMPMINRVEMVVSESHKRRIDQIHLDPLIVPPPRVPWPNLPVGTSGTVRASAQLGFVGVPDVDMEFYKRQGSFTFNNGYISPDGSKTSVTTDSNGIAEAAITADAAGLALIEVRAIADPELSAFLFFNIIPCPLVVNLDNDCDVDFIDYAMFASEWLNFDCGACNGADLNSDGTVDLFDLKIFAENWLAGK